MKKSCQEKKKERGITISVIKVEEKKEEQGKKGKREFKERWKKKYGVGEKITDHYKKKQKMRKKILRYESL